jgi:hypothetical protein
MAISFFDYFPKKYFATNMPGKSMKAREFKAAVCQNWQKRAFFGLHSCDSLSFDFFAWEVTSGFILPDYENSGRYACIGSS